MRAWSKAGILCIIGASAWAAACSANSSENQQLGSGGNSSGGSAGGAAVGGTQTGTGGGGNYGAIGGSGGTIIVPDSGNTGGTGNLDPDAACAAVAQEAKSVLRPADILWAIDTSCSMVGETAAVQNNINKFSQQIIASGIDVHVALIAQYGAFGVLPGICVSAPLGNPANTCPGAHNDSRPPTFLHTTNGAQGMQSTDGFNVLLNSFPQWSGILRAGASHWVVIVTDDDATDAPYGTPNPAVGAQQWIAAFIAKSPLLADFRMSGVYSFSACANAASVSAHWKAVIDDPVHGGVSGDICTCGGAGPCAQTFQTVINELATKIVQGSQPIDCQWAIPPAPAGQTFDATKVNVTLIDLNAGSGETIYHVPDAGQCDPTTNEGWYYDNNQSPSQVIACAGSCTKIKAQTNAKVNVEFGCATIDNPPH